MYIKLTVEVNGSEVIETIDTGQRITSVEPEHIRYLIEQVAHNAKRRFPDYE